jgi:hypothetical protein
MNVQLCSNSVFFLSFTLNHAQIVFTVTIISSEKVFEEAFNSQIFILQVETIN